MVLGAISCPAFKIKETSKELRLIKKKHNLPQTFEIKWTKVSPGKIDFYLEVIDYYFSKKALNFRALIVPNKTKLNHSLFDQDHNTWYYKMYFTLLKAILNPKLRYRIYLDIKDTCGGVKIAKLHEIISNNLYDFSQEIVERIQLVRSDEIELLQVCDLIIGAITYANRSLTTSTAKQEIIKKIKKASGYTLTKTTLLKEEKMNLFVWQPNFTSLNGEQ
jgi:hypothetical protein